MNMPLALTKRRVGASAAKFFVSLRNFKHIKQVTINMHSNKVLKKIWYAWYATHCKTYDMHDVQLLRGNI